MKLWVDDIRKAPDDSWTVARTVTSAINGIEFFRNSIEEISLDHDISYQLELNGVSRPYPSPETFKPVAMYLSMFHQAVGAGFLGNITIHSANPLGSLEMKNILESAGLTVEYKPMGAVNRLEQEV